MADNKFEDASGKPVVDNSLEDEKGNAITDVKDVGIPGHAIVTRGSGGALTTKLERTDTLKGKTAPYTGRVAAEALPATGSLFGPAGTVAGTGAMLMAKKYAPETFGQYNPDIGSQVGTAIKELFLNNMLPGVVSKVGGEISDLAAQGPRAYTASKLSDLPAVREGLVRQLTDRIQGHFENLPFSYQPALGDYQPIAIQPRTVGYQPISVNPGNPASEATVFRNNRYSTETIPGTPSSVIPVGGVQQIPSGTEVVLNGALEKGDDHLAALLSGKPIDAKAALGELSGKNASIYTDAMTPQTHTNLTEMLQTMKGMQDKNMADNIITYSKGRLAWIAGGAFFGHPLGGVAIAGMKTAPVALNAIMGKIMENPETARLVTIAMQTPASSPQAPLIQKALTEMLPRLVQSGADIAATPER